MQGDWARQLRRTASLFDAVMRDQFKGGGLEQRVGWVACGLGQNADAVKARRLTRGGVRDGIGLAVPWNSESEG